MADLAESPGGSIYIDTPEQIVKAFHDRVQSLSNIFAQDVCLSLHMHHGASLKDAFRVSPQIGRLSFVNDQTKLGVLERGRPQAFILELLIDSVGPGEHRLARIDVEGVVPAVDPRPVRSHYTLTLTFDTRFSRGASVPPDIAAAMGKLAIFKMQDRAMADIEMGRIEPAVSRLRTVATRLLDIGEVELARAALLEAGRLEQTGSLSPAGRKKIRFGTRDLGILPKEVRYD